ncbi:hypothetical protein [Mesorhizobium sp. M4B.F.Ca.ET.017.02.2.1]|uniref:hypothetical protein n=1 Tax=Mesorhizobium sp. M4B.F.Ca.ET.017.02.2.1 TaxID=2496649 RepID=UPI000FCB7923|nr:hypothetical protein [Mesorhizobium sp. M4B.F.Ca.ET.017.02.2.1]RVD31813.1 hypothetical protein EN738_00395 [Mesorhizobium sp. M4B.F.Ca.ET.017.02.2.1]
MPFADVALLSGRDFQADTYFLSCSSARRLNGFEIFRILADRIRAHDCFAPHLGGTGKICYARKQSLYSKALEIALTEKAVRKALR